MRISDWCSDVGSSDLAKARRAEFHPLPGGVDRSGNVELFGLTGVQRFQDLAAFEIDQVGVGHPGFLQRLPTDMLCVVAMLVTRNFFIGLASGSSSRTGMTLK